MLCYDKLGFPHIILKYFVSPVTFKAEYFYISLILDDAITCLLCDGIVCTNTNSNCIQKALPKDVLTSE